MSPRAASALPLPPPSTSNLPPPASVASSPISESFCKDNLSNVTFLVWLQALLAVWSPDKLLRLVNLLFPYDHSEAFNIAVSQAKDNAVSQMHVLKSKEIWMIVGTLAAGLDLAALALLPAPESRTVFDQLLAICAVTGFVASMCGPVVLGGVLLLNASACDVQNFDLFMLVARGSFQWNEVLVVIFNYATAGLVTTLPFVAITPRDELPSASPWLRGVAFSTTFAALAGVMALFTIWHLNTISYVASRANLFSQERAYEKSYGDCDTTVLTRLVAKAGSSHKKLHRRSYVFREVSRQATQYKRSSSSTPKDDAVDLPTVTLLGGKS